MLFIATMARIIISILLTFFSFQSHSQIAMWHAHNTPAACTGLGTDTIPDAFYSFRKLNSCYIGQCVRIRRSSDNTEQDFGFSGNFVDTSAIKSFVGANNGFVVTWYNQGKGGSTHDMSNSTQANQPSLVLSGALNYADGKLAVNFDGTNDILFSSNVFVSDKPFSFLSVSKRTGSGEFITMAVNYSISADYHALTNHNTFAIRSFWYTGGTVTIGTATTTTKFESSFWGTSLLYAYDGTNQSSTSYTGGPFTITNFSLGGSARSVFVYRQGRLVEAVGYKTDRYSDRSAISSNMKTYYGL